MSEAVQLSLLSPTEARRLTDEVKHDAESLWRKLVRLYEGGAHTALGYASWGAYFEAEFGGSGDYGYKLLRAGRVLDEVRVDHGLTAPNERQARELVPLLGEPDALREAWAEVVDLYPEPTAAAVREVVRRRMNDGLYSSATGQWSTPQDLFDELHQEFGFALDVCATDENAKCATYYTVEQDGLAQPWTGVCWMNPPYGDAIGAWVRKAWESSKAGATVVCLVPARIDTRWWWDYCRYGEVRFLRGRLKFGGGDNSAPFPSAVVIFGRSPNTLDAHWERAAA